MAFLTEMESAQMQTSHVLFLILGHQENMAMSCWCAIFVRSFSFLHFCICIGKENENLSERKHFYCLRLKNRIELDEKGF